VILALRDVHRVSYGDSISRTDRVAGVLALVALVACTCAGDPGDRQNAAATARAAVADAYDPAGPTGSISGRATFSGTPPKPRDIRMNADPYCARANPEGAERVAAVVGSDGELAEVLVYLKSGLPAMRFDTPPKPAVLDQVRCRYEPRVLAVQVNQPIEIRNDDATLHNVHATASGADGFNLGMPTQGMSAIRKFSRPDVFVKIQCDVHPWMEAFVGVVANPFFAVTGTDGSFHLDGIPPGQYVFEAAHPNLGRRTESVTVEAGKDATVWFNFTD